jgi:CRP-like cAMP-binding protein
MLKEIETIKASPLFENIQEPDLSAMLDCLGAAVRDYKKSEFIFLEGAELKQIGVVIEGSVYMVKEDVWGEKTILAVMTSGEIFGESFVCGDCDCSTVSFQASADCKILCLSFHRVLCVCRKACAYHNRLVENMVTLIAHKNVKLMEKMAVLSKKSIRDRILTWLSQQVQFYGSKTFLSPLGRLDLADYLCVDRSALTRELSRMKSDGLLDYDKNTFVLKAPVK